MRAFVSTYGLYNSGRLIGRWFDADELDDPDAVLAEIAAMASKAGVSEEVGEELMIQDHEGFPVEPGESQDVSTLYEVWSACNADPDLVRRVKLYVAATGSRDSWSDIVNAAEDMTVYEGDNLSDAVYNFLEEAGMLADLPAWARDYIDCERYGRDMLYGGFTEVRLDGRYYLVNPY
jgi:antirestriction protein